jgi:hypothetical protein
MKLELPDTKANLETPSGQKFYQNGDGTIDIPDSAAGQFVKAGIPGVKPYKKSWGGVDFDENGRIKR